MSNINNHAVDMNKQTLAELNFSAVKELNDEVAATCSGGEGSLNGPSPDLYLDADSNYGGAYLGVNAVINDGISYVGDSFNDQTSSIEIYRGTWNFYRDANYQGFLYQIGPGNYPVLAADSNDSISSLYRVG
ncbi:beta/gamma crystallin-related protein [Nostoc sp. FACHB-145]|uniref:beta/gamma crystallin-related protein n=1 Tax=Nostoc sp. FACHB-145 TaxID=2692836 RepID=UPI00168860F1|nr:beta/gamma crystallin-related protein [Nostoc sp. FACHB-145]MBD2468755.1 beta/gamma crystallin family protein [Nostoc sp. FACHB-145]